MGASKVYYTSFKTTAHENLLQKLRRLCITAGIKDIDFKSNRIQVLRKGGNYSYVYFNDDVAQVLTEYLEERIKKLEILKNRLNRFWYGRNEINQ